MASGYAPLWRRILYHIPGLFIKCLGHNYHWRWDIICHCIKNENNMGIRWYHNGEWERLT